VHEEVVELEKGDVCVFYTDGLTEARRGEEEFGYERLKDSAKELVHKSAAEGKKALLDKVTAFTAGQTLHDDLTLVILKWVGPDATVPTTRP
jgi:sigma-B regulation protein RsbU (phosphoserine phosphatase)